MRPRSSSILWFALSLSCSASATRGDRSTLPQRSATSPDTQTRVARASQDDASTISDATRAAPSRGEPAVFAQTLMSAGASADAWRPAGALVALGSRGALVTRVQSLARQRLAAMSDEDRQWMLEEYRASRRSRVRRPRRGILRSAGRARAGSEPVAAHSTASESAGSSSRASITHNQVASVDEGDIVKASGDDLIVLRRGMLFRLSLAGGTVRRSSTSPAFAPGTRPGDWYDELIVDRDVALVLGYSYRARATEVNRFRLERGGGLRYLDSFYVRSNDYYSSENYATRLVGGRLLLYVPSPVLNENLFDRRLKVPEVRFGSSGAFRDVLDDQRIFATDRSLQGSTLHTVLSCDVHAPRVACSAQGVLSGDSRTFYVSATATYLWTARNEPLDPQAPNAVADGRSWIVRIPHDTRTAPGAVMVRGAPVDQFAFDERGDTLHVLLQSNGAGDGMWSSLASAGTVGAVRIPLSRMTGAISDAESNAYTTLVRLAGRGPMKERWVGEWALFGVGSTWVDNTVLPDLNDNTATDMARSYAGQLFAYHASDQRLFRVQAGHGVERVEPLGSHAIAIGRSGSELVFTTLALDRETPEVMSGLRLANSAQGETRSHGFFFRQTGPRDGVLGIATARGGRSGFDQLRASSDVSFFRVRSLALRALGTIPSRPLDSGRCAVSCADWYGNTRPIFYGERVFALMGDELVEAQLGEQTVTERARVDFGEGVRGVIPEVLEPSTDDDL
jgi:hypothetical protein